ncbi:MAG TPA: CDP-alcohol phosphatidyltransferase family protein [Pyrinomonadaceae bacterium]
MSEKALDFNARREQFAGATKVSASILSPLERRMARVVVPRIPLWLGTHHLTMLTLAWCALVVLFSRLAADDRRWLWAVSACVVLQYVTDFFDGKVGKYRDTGLVKWGFYMDHLLDYVFACSVVAGYWMILPAHAQASLFLLLAVFGGFMVNSFLAFAATAEFKISHLKLGPTEFRIALVVNNALVALFGTKHMTKALPYVAWGGLAGLCLLVYATQRRIWQRDIEAKRRRDDEATKLRGATRSAA